ncbi:MAG: nucleotidyltransferase family protein [Candidatus Omnitrophota bacterium]
MLCARIKTDDRIRSEIRDLLGQHIDWQKVADIASYHHIKPLVYYHLGKIDPSVMPAGLHAGAEIDHIITRNLFLSEEFRRIASGLKQAGVRVMPLKGIFFINTLYENLPLRYMYDIDILVRNEDLPSVERYILGSGYAPAEEVSSPETAKQLRYRRDNAFHFRYEKNDPLSSMPVILEVHRDLFPPSRSRKALLPGILTGAKDTEIGDACVLAMAAEDLLIYLCIKQFSDHPYSPRLRGLCDISESLKYFGGNIDWDKMVKNSVRYDAAPMVYYALGLAGDLLMPGEAMVPAGVMHGLSPSILKKTVLGQSINKERFFSVIDEKRPIIHLINTYIFELMSVRGIMDILRLARTVLYNKDFYYYRILGSPGYKRWPLYLLRLLQAPFLLMKLLAKTLRRHS